MKHYTDIHDIDDLSTLIDKAIALKKNPYEYHHIGKHKTLGMLFFNPSLRTRMSTQKAAQNLGMNVIVMNLNDDGWQLEFEDGGVMNQNTSEHIREAAQVMSQYCDVLAIRSFATLKDKTKDESEHVINSFKKYADIPIINMESSTAHPLQGLTDMITIREQSIQKSKPKVVLSWAPHPKALPHAVANSFIQFTSRLDHLDLVITNPEGYDLNPEITKNIPIIHHQEEAFKDADFIYTKNWASYEHYGTTDTAHDHWTIDKEKMALTNNAKFMHCLPVRRNIVVTDDVLDSPQSIVIAEANNRTYAAQTILKEILTHGDY